MAIKFYSGDRSAGLAADGKPTGILAGHLHGEWDTGLLFQYNGTGWQTSGQYAFKTFSVSGQSDVVADSFDDTLNLVAGSNISITTTPGSDSITFNATNTTYTAGDGLDLTGTTFSAHLAADPGASNLVLEDATSGNPVVTLPAATTSLAGLLTSSDKSKLDGIEAGAEVNQNALSTINIVGGGSFSALTKTDTVNFDAAGAASISVTGDTITFSATDTNTTYTAGDGLTLSGTTFAAHLTADPAASSVVLEDSTSANAVVTLSAATTSLAGVMSAADKTKLNGIASGAEVNQNAFATFSVAGQSDVVADSKTDTLNLAEGSNVTITTDAGTDTITIAATDTDTTYTAGTGLSLAGTTFSTDLSTLTDMTASMIGTDEFIVLDAGADRRKAANEIGLSIFNNDAGFLTAVNLGDTYSATQVTITNDSGDNAVIDAATTSTAGVMSAADKTFLDSLDNAVTLQGTWDASTGSFPSGADNGYSYIVSVGGTVDGVEFVANDRIVAIADSASTTTYSGNWHKLDYTDQVLSVNSQTGAVSLGITDLNDVSAVSGNQTTIPTYAGTLTQDDILVWDANGNVSASGYQVRVAADTWSDIDTEVPTASLIQDYVTSNFISSVTTGTGSGLTGGATSGDADLNLDINELTANAATILGVDRIAIYDTSAGTTGRKDLGSINLSVFNDDLGVVTGPAGSDSEIQFNNGGSFGAESNFAWDDADKMLQIVGSMRVKEGGTIPTPANDEAVYYVETEVINTTDTVTRVMMRRGDGQDIIISSYIN